MRAESGLVGSAAATGAPHGAADRRTGAVTRGACHAGIRGGHVGGAALYQDYESRQLDEVLRGASTSQALARRSRARARPPGDPTLGVSTIVREGGRAHAAARRRPHCRHGLPGSSGNMGWRATATRSSAGSARSMWATSSGCAVEGTFTYVVESTQIVDPGDGGCWIPRRNLAHAGHLLSVHLLGKRPSVSSSARLVPRSHPRAGTGGYELPATSYQLAAAVDLRARVRCAGAVDAGRHHRQLLPIGGQGPGRLLFRVAIAGSGALDRGRVHTAEGDSRR